MLPSLLVTSLFDNSSTFGIVWIEFARATAIWELIEPKLFCEAVAHKNSARYSINSLRSLIHHVEIRCEFMVDSLSSTSFLSCFDGSLVLFFLTFVILTGFPSPLPRLLAFASYYAGHELHSFFLPNNMDFSTARSIETSFLLQNSTSLLVMVSAVSGSAKRELIMELLGDTMTLISSSELVYLIKPSS